MSKENDILVYGTGRRRLEPNNKFWDVYFDPIYKSGLKNYIHLERPRNASHYSPIQTEDFKYIDLILYGSQIPLKLGLEKPTIPNNVNKELIEIKEKIKNEFGVNVNIKTLVRDNLHLRKTRHFLFNKLLRRINPKVLIIECSYGKETLIEVSKSLNIPVIELQHGIITKHHLGYSYKNATKRMFPDYLLVWGDYWKESAEIPLPDDRVISTGYPYLDYKKEEHNNINTRKQVVFISQDTIGEELSELAVSLSQYDNFDYKIVYKLHPKEYQKWKGKYPNLLRADLRVVGGDGPGIYKLLAESSIQIGVYSTALFEGIAFGLDTYVYKISGWRSIEELVNNGPAQVISSPKQVLSLIGQSNKNEKSIHIFKNNGVKNTIEEINRIKNGGSTYDNTK
ncbi:hypothetical protein [Halorubrum sp. SD626R]|uniref:hypothetical protein n=1 Tax=Halorubrum sp. SD626R TaxID=1419722 RepID=UPI0011363DE4|nr:hypothetical protein [Halorubrum sp. SD626R]TKX82266.1 hypothetical protein EXE53_01270 [Halorubrum sp. SD626R]